VTKTAREAATLARKAALEEGCSPAEANGEAQAAFAREKQRIVRRKARRPERRSR